jgi:hypothetical protein
MERNNGHIYFLFVSTDMLSPAHCFLHKTLGNATLSPFHIPSLHFSRPIVLLALLWVSFSCMRATFHVHKSTPSFLVLMHICISSISHLDLWEIHPASATFITITTTNSSSFVTVFSFPFNYINIGNLGGEFRSNFFVQVTPNNI